MLHLGRVPQTSKLGLENASVAVDNDGFIIGNHSGEAEKSSVNNIYAIGDVLKVSRFYDFQCMD